MGTLRSTVVLTASSAQVVVPQAVGLTTLRGAVLYGLDPDLVASRRSKHTIGVGVLKRFQPGEHPQGEFHSSPAPLSH